MSFVWRIICKALGEELLCLVIGTSFCWLRKVRSVRIMIFMVGKWDQSRYLREFITTN